MSPEFEEIQARLLQCSENTHKVFFEKAVPGAQKIYGVKTQVLNQLAKAYKNGTFELAEELWRSDAFEEKIIAVKIMERTGKSDPRRLLALFRKFSKGIDNWAVCDGLGMQCLKGIVTTKQEEIFNIARMFNHSKDPWRRRLSLVMVEWYTRDASCHKKISELVKNLENDQEYYVKKAVDWIKRNLKKGK
jgi:3-methyladenine DNA glycosylase AlkD